MNEQAVSKGVEALARLWATLPEDVRQALAAAVEEGLDTSLVVLSARLATTDFAKAHPSFPKVLGRIIGRLREWLHGGQ